MTRIPREYTAQDHLSMASDFNFNVSTNLEVVASRREQRGKHANIIDDQSAGIDVGNRVLASLDDPTLQGAWVQLYGGAMLNSALYTLRGIDNQPMSRHFKLPQLVNPDGTLQDDDQRRTNTLSTLDADKTESRIHEQLEREGNPTDRETMRLGRRLGNSSMLVGIFSADFYENDDEYTNMTKALQQETEMHHAIQKLAQRLGVNPSLAQLRAESTPFGAHIIQSPTIPLGIKSAFRSAVGEVGDELGY